MINKTTCTNKWIVLTITFLFMIAYALSLQSLPPLFSHITEDIPLSDSHAGMLMGAYAIPGIILPIVVAFLANKLNKKLIINIALVVMIIGLIGFSWSKSFPILLSFRVMAGIGSTIVAVLSPMLITMFFDDSNMGIAMGVLNSAVPVGTVFTANLFGTLGEKIHWKIIILGVAAFVGIVLIITLILLSLPENKKGDNSQLDENDSKNSIRTNKKLWAIAFIWALTNAQILSYVTFGSQYYQSIGLSIHKSGLYTSFIMLIPAILSFLIGIIIDKYGGKKQLFIIGSIIVVVSFVLLTKASSALMLVAILLGIGITPIPVLVFSILPDIVEPQQVGIGLGILTSLANVGITIGPSAFGFLLEKTNRNFSVGFIISALLSVLIIFILVKLNIQEKNDSFNN